MLKNNINKIFEAIEAACLMEGGDGDTLVICRNKLKVADNFEKFLQESDNKRWRRSNSEIVITFYHDQENINFVDEIDRNCLNCTFVFEDKYGFLEN